MNPQQKIDGEKPLLYLASASPRRKQLLEEAGFRLVVLPSNVPEQHLPGEGYAEYSLRNAREKAVHVAKTLREPQADWVIGADTIVVSGGKLLEKPADDTEARAMLNMLSDSWHEVFTSYVVVSSHQKEPHVAKSILTKVRFRKLLDSEITSYIDSREPFDKAGGYGIQGAAMGFVREIAGSYTNVMGLPLAEVIESLRDLEKETKETKETLGQRSGF